MRAASTAAELKVVVVVVVGGGGGQSVSAQTITPHTASNWSARLSSQKEAPSKDDTQENPQTVC